MPQFIAKIVARWSGQYRNVVTIKQGHNHPDIYVAPGFGNGLHASYHRDGRHHWRVHDPATSNSVQLSPAQHHDPLANLTRMQNLISMSFDISRSELTTWKGKRDNQTVIFDVPKNSPWLNVVGLVLPVGHMEELTSLVQTMQNNVDPICLQIITATQPWIGIIVYGFQTNR